MPNPREAIYDVLRSKWRRRQDEARAAANAAAWAEYEQANAVAKATYRPEPKVKEKR